MSTTFFLSRVIKMNYEEVSDRIFGVVTSQIEIVNFQSIAHPY